MEHVAPRWRSRPDIDSPLPAAKPERHGFTAVALRFTWTTSAA
jgi:hypothetical protein